MSRRMTAILSVLALALLLELCGCGSDTKDIAQPTEADRVEDAENVVDDEDEDAQSTSDIDRLIGTWQSVDERGLPHRVAFDNESIIWVSGTWPATIDDTAKTITVEGSSETFSMGYSLGEDGTLTITDEGESEVYEKVSDSPDDIIEHTKIALGDTVESDEWDFEINGYEWIDGKYQVSNGDCFEDIPDSSYLVVHGKFTNKYTEEVYLDRIMEAVFVIAGKYNVSPTSLTAEPANHPFGPVQPLGTEEMLIIVGLDEGQRDAIKDGLTLSIALPLRIDLVRDEDGSSWYTLAGNKYAARHIYELDLS